MGACSENALQSEAFDAARRCDLLRLQQILADMSIVSARASRWLNNGGYRLTRRLGAGAEGDAGPSNAPPPALGVHWTKPGGR
jgi:hypothetical protein